MKLFKRIGLGVGAGLAVACIISFCAAAWPGLSCACEFVACFLDCNNNTNHLEAACEDCDQCLKGEGPGKTFDYKSTFIYSIVVCTVLGGIWGAAGTIKDASEASRKRKETNDKARNDRYIANQKEMVKNLENFISYAEQTSDGLHKQFNEIQYKHNNYKESIGKALNDCKKKKEETEALMNRLTSGRE